MATSSNTALEPRAFTERHQGQWLEAGCDEAGRGCLAGPVTAAAVILPADVQHPLLKDSKLLSPEQREEARTWIETFAVAWAVRHVSPAVIDRINILQASFRAMHLALAALDREPDCIAVDGNRFPAWRDKPHQTLVKGDRRFLHIAAASILAKTHRDARMQTLDRKHPGYGWASNKGYPTLDHKRAIARIGPSPVHRRSFNWTLPEASA
jgi:ribonuclease HII